MQRKFLCIVIALLITMVAQWSCRTDRDVVVNPTFSDLTIEEAKSWMQSQNSGARLIAGQKAAKRTEYWNAAQKLTYKNGLPVVVVPLAYNYQNPTVFWNRKPEKGKKYDKSDLFIQKKLLVYKDPKGNMQADVISIIPTNDNRKKNKKAKGDDFDGYVLAYDKTEQKFMGGWYYENGKAKRRARLNGSKNGRLMGVMGDCDILVYEYAGGQQSAQVGTGDSSPATGFYDGAGNYWQLAYTIPMDCGGGPSGSDPNTPSGNDSNTGDPGWTWTDSGQGGGGGGGGGNNTSGDPYTPVMITEDGYVGASAADNFFYDMEYNHAPSIVFDENEKSVIREYDYLIYDIRSYADANGYKPSLGSNLDGWFYDESNNQSGKVSLKVVGVDSYNEDTDYRIYGRACEAYKYLFEKAVSSSSEYGAYITAKGIIVMPNSQSYTGADGKRHIKFRRWRIGRDSQNLIVPTDKGIFPVLGFVHTHPEGPAEPSQPDDTDLAAEHPVQKHYVMNKFVMNQFFADGTTTFFIGVLGNVCP